MQKENRRTKMTKMLFRTALVELMQEKSFSKITVKEICDRADLNRTTFYKHYNDQEDILDEIESDLIERSIAYMKNVSREEGTVAMIEAYLHYVKENAVLFRVMFSGLGNDNRIFSYTSNVLQHLQSNLPDYGTPVQEHYILSFIMNGSFRIILTWIDSDFDIPERELARLIYTLCDSISDRFSAEQ